MLGIKPDEFIREPFIWDYSTQDAAQTTWTEPRYSTDKTVVPWRKQIDDPTSLLNFYKKLIAVRNASEILSAGGIEESGLNIAEVVSFTRTLGNDSRLVLNNIADIEITIKLTGTNTDFKKIEFDSNGASTLTDGNITLPAYTTLILKK